MASAAADSGELQQAGRRDMARSFGMGSKDGVHRLGSLGYHTAGRRGGHHSPISNENSQRCILDLLEAHRGEVEVDIAPRSVCSEAVIEFDKH